MSPAPRTPPRLGVNIDHVATVRQARGTHYPDPVHAALLAEQGGADGITLHLREDRRHIQDHDLERLVAVATAPVNLELAVTEEMIAIAEATRPAHCCLVPERRAELTTEGGLDVAGAAAEVAAACARLRAVGTQVSLFIDPDPAQVRAAAATGAEVVELHTGAYADAPDAQTRDGEFERVCRAAELATGLGLVVNAGHGLHYHNTAPIAAVPGMNELNIGHAIIARAVLAGLEQAVRDMKAVIAAVRP